jgi:hypothetical protein
LRFNSSCKIFTLYLSSNLVVNYTHTLICILFLLLYDKVSAEPWTTSLGREFGLFEPYCRSWSTCGSHYGFMSFGTRCIRVQDHASSSHCNWLFPPLMIFNKKLYYVKSASSWLIGSSSSSEEESWLADWTLDQLFTVNPKFCYSSTVVIDAMSHCIVSESTSYKG